MVALMDAQHVISRHNVADTGPGCPPMVFVHGFGCDQTMWRHVAPKFESECRTVLYDLLGMGKSALAAYDFDRHADLVGHADDLVDVLDALDLRGVTLVGHSVGASIAVLAARRATDRVESLILVSPSPSFLNDPANGYQGGFEKGDLEGLVDLLNENQLGWSQQMAPQIVGHPAEDPNTEELTQSFCRTHPRIATHFARATFLADSRDEFAGLLLPTLIVHCDQDALVPMPVLDWMQRHMPHSDVEVLSARGHCPHMTIPESVTRAIGRFLTNGRK
jgi:sigma-B regulation protein RsbQ